MEPDKIVDIIIDIKERNPSLEQGDIAVIFLTPVVIFMSTFIR